MLKFARNTYPFISPMKTRTLMMLLTAAMPLAMADDYSGWQATHPEWQLVFADDFDGTSLDTTKWNKIDYVNWQVSDWRKYQSQDDELVTMNGDGTVSLWGKYGDYTSQSDQTGTNDTYACGGIFTNKTFTFQYGYVEVRAKFDCAPGAWPAIWMMPVNGPWPQTGEIDILEHLNYEGIVHQTLHYNDANGNKTTAGTVNAQGGSTAYFTSVEDKAEFHTYGVEWTPEGVKFFMDGQLTLHAPTETDNPNWPFNKENNPYYLMLDMQLGGGWVGEIGDIGDGVAMTLDYVRVYSAVPEPTAATLGITGLILLLLRRRRQKV